MQHALNYANFCVHRTQGRIGSAHGRQIAAPTGSIDNLLIFAADPAAFSTFFSQWFCRPGPLPSGYPRGSAGSAGRRGHPAREGREKSGRRPTLAADPENPGNAYSPRQQPKDNAHDIIKHGYAPFRFLPAFNIHAQRRKVNPRLPSAAVPCRIFPKVCYRTSQELNICPL